MTGMKKAPFSLGYIHGHREVTQPRIADTGLEVLQIIYMVLLVTYLAI